MTTEANDKVTYMTDLEKCLNKLEAKGFSDQFKMQSGRLLCVENNKEYNPHDLKAVNFYRFEGQSDPDDMSILYAIETNDGHCGTLVDAYGLYADKEIGDFMRDVEIHKSVKDTHVY